MQQQYLSILKNIILKKIDKTKHLVFLFGSRAQGNNSSRSDVDVGFYSLEPLGVVLKNIHNEIEESIVPYKVDLVDFSQVDDNFKKEATKEIEIWSQPQNLNVSMLTSKKQ